MRQICDGGETLGVDGGETEGRAPDMEAEDRHSRWPDLGSRRSAGTGASQERLAGGRARQQLYQTGSGTKAQTHEQTAHAPLRMQIFTACARDSPPADMAVETRRLTLTALLRQKISRCFSAETERLVDGWHVAEKDPRARELGRRSKGEAGFSIFRFGGILYMHVVNRQMRAQIDP